MDHAMDFMEATILELREEIARLREEIALARGAMNAQDERERVAGERCGVSHAVHGCDWPEVVADEIISLREELAAANEKLRRRSNSPDVAVKKVMWEQMKERAEQAEQREREALAMLLAADTIHGPFVDPMLPDTPIAAMLARAREQEVKP